MPIPDACSAARGLSLTSVVLLSVLPTMPDDDFTTNLVVLMVRGLGVV